MICSLHFVRSAMRLSPHPTPCVQVLGSAKNFWPGPWSARKKAARKEHKTNKEKRRRMKLALQVGCCFRRTWKVA